MTKWTLFTALATGGTIAIVERAADGSPSNTISALAVLAVEREDGSGSSFNVTGYDKLGKTKTVHVRTID